MDNPIFGWSLGTGQINNAGLDLLLALLLTFLNKRKFHGKVVAEADLVHMDAG